MKNENPLISVIVPVYNAENYLHLCIASLLAQTHKNLEIILVNDGSKDSSLSICRGYADKDKRIKVIDKPNTGVSDTRNIGIEAAKGEYIMFCDSDDCVAPDWCRCLLEAQTDEMLTMCKYQIVDTEEMTERLLDREEEQKDGEVVYIDRRDFIFYRDRGFFFPVNKLFIKSVVEEHNIKFPIEISLGEDLAFVLAYLKASKGNIRLIPNVLYYYRTTGQDSLSRKAPTVEQCEMFYQMLTSAMTALSVENKEAWKCRDEIVVQDFEKRFFAISHDNRYSSYKKYKLVKQAMNTEAYSICCKNTTVSSNKVYQWMLSHRKAFLLTIYLKLRERSA